MASGAVQTNQYRILRRRGNRADLCAGYPVRGESENGYAQEEKGLMYAQAMANSGNCFVRNSD
jgi:hypothetical protein